MGRLSKLKFFRTIVVGFFRAWAYSLTTCRLLKWNNYLRMVGELNNGCVKKIEILWEQRCMLISEHMLICGRILDSLATSQSSICIVTRIVSWLSVSLPPCAALCLRLDPSLIPFYLGHAPLELRNALWNQRNDTSCLSATYISTGIGAYITRNYCFRGTQTTLFKKQCNPSTIIDFHKLLQFKWQ